MIYVSGYFFSIENLDFIEIFIGENLYIIWKIYILCIIFVEIN